MVRVAGKPAGAGRHRHADSADTHSRGRGGDGLLRPSIVIALVGLLAIASHAFAQAPLEVGGGLAFAGMRTSDDDWGEGLKDLGLEVHATAAVTARFGIDVSTTFGRRTLPNDAFLGAV